MLPTMIDLHNHILPALDDGARDLDEALTMAKMAVDSGIAIMAATPHRFFRGREITAAAVMAQLDDLQCELDSRSIALRLAPGSEMPIVPDLLEGICSRRLLRLGGPTGTHALIETPFDRVPPNALPILRQIANAGIGIVLAHPERNDEVQRDLAFIESCASLGAVLQITSGSVLGRFGPLALATAKAMVCRSDWRVIIASDAHWAHDRAPDHLRAAVEAVGRWLGDPERAEWMVNQGPASCLPPCYRLREPPAQRSPS
jgi:protein-tyrosine phosphatase